MAKNRFSHLKRKTGTREENKSILIVCGGEETEPNYFKAFETYSGCVIHVKKSHKGTSKLVEKALEFKNQNEYDSVWCVFDKDDFTDFDQAIDLANKHGIEVAYSNKCFEIWVLMHFGKSPKIHQKELEKEADKSFKNTLKEKQGYSKNMDNLYMLLKSRQKVAIEVATRCYADRELHGESPSTQVGVTTVHNLVNMLNENSPNKWD
ncbi:RloB family protein [Lysinibacillus piscis]|uniref:RloB domain-containing protein n=1 Tax=Lysinibacillus piscis TaxID=2518931 RepID=A0ABQ5NI80_9BACI|nr:RloB family protein [Lysinibacillus sp. KH24]GLC88062.1 hypothetical protein LYSBPC_11890 [Lysinibacillus sp. KH24]